MNNDQMGCKHRYVQSKRTNVGYFFKCVYCGKEIFGAVSDGNRK